MGALAQGRRGAGTPPRRRHPFRAGRAPRERHGRGPLLDGDAGCRCTFTFRSRSGKRGRTGRLRSSPTEVLDAAGALGPGPPPSMPPTCRTTTWRCWPVRAPVSACAPRPNRIWPTASARPAAWPRRGAPHLVGLRQPRRHRPLPGNAQPRVRRAPGQRSRGHWAAHELLAAATATGHRAIGWPEAGRISVGALADLVTIDLGSPRLARAGRRAPCRLVGSVRRRRRRDARCELGKGRRRRRSPPTGGRRGGGAAKSLDRRGASWAVTP